ncbi:MAG: hypothetical protein J0I34_25830 [Pseudonocardia sp.]|uniref:hypothetical protein n=1 Tax=Pseudonocardia sp. SCN 73-27 TaxID=1660132 RepID=UPI00086B6F49|nr:hypothetical protein [Pseudonocardia sp. SCN 73-27]MBN9112193.1 hypothetical protein [Pseudonocardia sp.]ODU30183.1 MAG: hypothetical protein ABS80_00565 [Pseudonocardia sp. SCN 72-51]ODV03117.1 MAG: hypothetical protein ABT15_23790 [Pseudonocardia sp. SCN 73-27]
MQLRPGTRLQSVRCTTQVIVVRSPQDDVDVRCGGAPMTAAGATATGAPDAAFAGGSVLGKRYTDGEGLELLVTKGGEGSLSVGDTPLVVQEAKRLPSSD